MFGFGKGKIDLELSSYNYSAGDTIEGTATLKLNKPFKARGMKVRFYGERFTSNRSTVRLGNNTQANRNTVDFVFDFTQPLDGAKEYSGESTYKFKIKIPKNLQTDPTLPGAGGAIVKTLQMFSNQSSRVDWYVKAFLDIPLGIDVSKTVQINIA
jgi:hypothetical protein